jgi:hypothetical protein
MVDPKEGSGAAYSLLSDNLFIFTSSGVKCAGRSRESQASLTTLNINANLEANERD